jgi:hypothetical protein
VNTEFAILLGVMGLPLIWFGWFHHDRGWSGDDGVLMARPPGWLRALTRHGDGPVRAVSVALEVYGAGLTVLGFASAAAGPNARFLVQAQAAWLLVGIPVIGIADAYPSVRGWVRRNRHPDVD